MDPDDIKALERIIDYLEQTMEGLGEVNALDSDILRDVAAANTEASELLRKAKELEALEPETEGDDPGFDPLIEAYDHWEAQ